MSRVTNMINYVNTNFVDVTFLFAQVYFFAHDGNFVIIYHSLDNLDSALKMDFLMSLTDDV